MDLPKSGFFSTLFSAFLRPFIRALDKGAAPTYGGELPLPGLRQPVEVFWDRYAIPHVSATDEHDLFFAQGYLHAQERLWQMEMNRRFLCSRMAEIFGDFALPWRMRCRLPPAFSLQITGGTGRRSLCGAAPAIGRRSECLRPACDAVPLVTTRGSDNPRSEWTRHAAL